MSKQGFRKPRKRDQEAVDQFAEGADVSTNTENTKSQEAPEEEHTQQPFYTTLQPQFKAIIQAAAYYERRSEEHTSELQSRFDLVCRLLLEKKKHVVLQELRRSRQSRSLRRRAN